MRELCERYRLPYVSGPLPVQYAQVVRKILRMALPGGGPPAAAEAELSPAGVASPDAERTDAELRSVA